MTEYQGRQYGKKSNKHHAKRKLAIFLTGLVSNHIHQGMYEEAPMKKKLP